MTTDEKLKAIIDRVPVLHKDDDAQYISMLVITHYMTVLRRLGLVIGSYEVTPLGEAVVAVCEEFDWKPTDEDIALFMEATVVADEDKGAFTHFVKQYRDNREELLEKIKKFKSNSNN